MRHRLDQRWVVYSLFAFFFFDLWSLAAYTLPHINWISLAVWTGGVWYLVHRDLRWALWLPAGELFWGSFGSGFFWEAGGVRFTLRMLLFAVCMMVWLTRSGNRARVQVPFKSTQVKLYFLLLGIVLWGYLVAFASGTSLPRVFFDGNAYLYLLYFPLWMQVFKESEAPLQSLFFAAACALAIKTLVFFHIFANPYEFLNVPYLYLWIRDTRVGEITYITGSVFRIFIQSQIFIAVALAQYLVVRAYEPMRGPAPMFVMTLLIAALITSFSRSFWLGFLVAFVLALAAGARSLFRKWKQALSLVSSFGGSLMVSLLLVFALATIPFGGGGFSESLTSRLARTSQDPASQSRVQLLGPLAAKIFEHPIRGAGFGASVTYASDDPRIKNFSNPEGVVTTYAFEWGYLDQWLKWGAIGLALFVVVLIAQLVIGMRLLSLASDHATIAAALIGLLVIMAVHMVSPYLNHPLGLGYLMLTMLTLHRSNV